MAPATSPVIRDKNILERWGETLFGKTRSEREAEYKDLLQKKRALLEEKSQWELEQIQKRRQIAEDINLDARRKGLELGREDTRLNIPLQREILGNRVSAYQDLTAPALEAQKRATTMNMIQNLLLGGAVLFTD